MQKCQAGEAEAWGADIGHEPRWAGIGQRGLQTMKNLSILNLQGFFLVLDSLREAGQSISSSISFALAVIDSETVSRELLGPADLSRVQALSIDEPIKEPMKVVVIREHKNLMLTALKVVPLRFGGLNKGQELAIVGLVLSLSRNHFFE